MKRKAEFVLGLIAGILGLIISGLIFIGNIDTSRSHFYYLVLSIQFILSILGIIGCKLVKTKPKLAGLFMILAAVGCGIIPYRLLSAMPVSAAFTFIPSILFMISGIMGLIKKG